MRKHNIAVLVVSLLFTATNAFATNEHEGNDDSNGGSTAISVEQDQNQNQNQNQHQSQHNSQKAFGGSGIGIGIAGASTGNVNASSSYNQVRQTPFAYAPSNAVGYNPFKCTDTASLGASAGFGAISGGMPINDATCKFFVKVDFLFRNGFVEEGCELLLTDDELAPIFLKTHRECSRISKSVQTAASVQAAPMNVPSNDYWDKASRKLDAQLKTLNNHH
jgi:hypothetical protein